MNTVLHIIGKELQSKGFATEYVDDHLTIAVKDVPFTFILKTYGQNKFCLLAPVCDSNACVRKIMNVKGDPEARHYEKAVSYYSAMFRETLTPDTQFSVTYDKLCLYRTFNKVPLANDVMTAMLLLYADAQVFKSYTKA